MTSPDASSSVTVSGRKSGFRHGTVIPSCTRKRYCPEAVFCKKPVLFRKRESFGAICFNACLLSGHFGTSGKTIGQVSAPYRKARFFPAVLSSDRFRKVYPGKKRRVRAFSASRLPAETGYFLSPPAGLRGCLPVFFFRMRFFQPGDAYRYNAATGHIRTVPGTAGKSVSAPKAIWKRIRSAGSRWGFVPAATAIMKNPPRSGSSICSSAVGRTGWSPVLPCPASAACRCWRLQ